MAMRKRAGLNSISADFGHADEDALTVVLCDQIDFTVGIDVGKPKLCDPKIRRFPEIGI